MGLRTGNALEWGIGSQAYPQIFIIFLFLFSLLFFLLAGKENAFLRGMQRITAYELCFVLYDTLLLLAFDLLSFIFHFHLLTRAWLVAVAALLSMLLLLYGSIHARNLRTVSYSVKLDEQDKKAKVVLLSDLHIGIFIGTSYLKKVVECVNRMKPDLIVISGDILDGYLPSDQELQGIADVLRQLRSKFGVYAVSGNHDPAGTEPKFCRFLKKSGIHFLYNDSVTLDEWNIVGRTGIVDMKGGRIPLAHILQYTDPRKPTIVLDHDPQGIREAVDCGVDLILCGHTHKGQFFPMNIFTKLANGSQYFYGYAVNENTQSIISAGTGFFDMPIRIGTDSEIVEIHVE